LVQEPRQIVSLQESHGLGIYFIETNHKTHSPVAVCLNSIHNDGAHTRNSSTKTDCYWINSGMQWFIRSLMSERQLYIVH